MSTRSKPFYWRGGEFLAELDAPPKWARNWDYSADSARIIRIQRLGGTGTYTQDSVLNEVFAGSQYIVLLGCLDVNRILFQLPQKYAEPTTIKRRLLKFGKAT